MENNLKINMNERRVLKQIFNNHNISRTQISKNLEINKATISNILNALKKKSLVIEVGEGNSTKSGGRKPILLKINKHYGYYISMDLTYSSVELMYNYFDGTVLKHESYNLPDKKVSSILAILKANIPTSESYDTSYGLLGVSVSIHGIVDHNQNIIYLPFHESEGISITDELRLLTQVPVIIENEANLSAIYERSIHSNSEMRNLITLSIHKGIGAGLIIDKKLYRGSNGEAGEIGKTLVLQNGETYNKIENICSQEALIQSISKQFEQNLSLPELIELYHQHNDTVIQEIDYFTTKIAVLIHNLNTQFNPDMIYINCTLINELPVILDSIKTQLHQYSTHSVQLNLTTNVKHATLLGGSIAIMQKLLNIDDIQLKFN
ncbi:transcriptional repressor XylR [Staphylococcus sp. NAM3COL9]|uniref:transcriptional repressor XylR n=1 Tax=Staphylococcus sp. NAM3COL9 TaxID=1667172 RepID=UPI0007103C95|nr:ROK family transcriptional regulator [Staphylococcus sp. NAM3COL9]KRG08554.1 XylR family transcriptional regulator [Staphylococcus sp. NAM3COL9]